MAMIPAPHVFMVQYGQGHGDEDGLSYSYIIDKNEIARLMGGEMPPVRRTAPHDKEGLLQWLEQHQHLPPPSHSPAMLVNTNAKTTTWQTGYLEDWNGHPPSRSRGFTPPRQDMIHRDDSSEDSYHSSTSGGNKFNNFSRNTCSPAGGDYRNYRGTLLRFQAPSYPRLQDPEFSKRHFFGGYQRGRQRTMTPRNYLGSTNSYIPPDRFLSHGHLIHVSATPAAISSLDCDQLSKSIWEMFIAKQQAIETYKEKIYLWKELFVFIRSSFPKFGLFLVGSTMSGLGSNSSDVDMCLMVRFADVDQRNEALAHLRNVAYYLRQSSFVHNVELIHAKVPILKLKSKGLEVDLNCNNAVGIRNTHLLYCYAQVDWRVRPLVIVVKLWAAKHNINDAKRMTVSSYSWALMVIHYLQCGVQPSVLPCLQKMFPEKFSSCSDINHIDLHEELPPIPSGNKDSLGKLLLGFLQYYRNFDFSRNAISVRQAAAIPIDECRRSKSIKNDPHQWKYLCIEEPFDLSNTARSVYDYGSFERVRRAIQVSYEHLHSTQRLESIF